MDNTYLLILSVLIIGCSLMYVIGWTKKDIKWLDAAQRIGWVVTAFAIPLWYYLIFH